MIIGLRSKIFLTFTLVLTLSGLATGVVFWSLWSRDVLLLNIDLVEQVIDSEIAINGIEEFEDRSNVNRLNGVMESCVGQVSEEGSVDVSQNCPAIEQFSRVMATCSRTGQNLKEIYNLGWNPFAIDQKVLTLCRVIQNKEKSEIIGFQLRFGDQDGAGKYHNAPWVYLLINVVIFSAIGFFRMVKIALSPIEELAELSEKFDLTGVSPEFRSKSGSEFRKLRFSVSQMLKRIADDRLNLQESVKKLEEVNRDLENNKQLLVRSEKLASVGRLSAGLAHEIGNPLSIVIGYLDLLGKSDLTNDERKQFSTNSIAELTRINKLIQQLLDFSRKSQGTTQTIAIHSLIQEIVEILKVDASFKCIEIEVLLGADSDQVRADWDLMKQVFLNCLFNAGDAIGNSGEKYGKILIETHMDSNTNNEVVITIRDNGPGIPEQYVENVFDPFFTTKEPGQGTGLGLYVAHSIVDSFGGRIIIDTTQPEGTAIVMNFPTMKEES